jgi:RNA polymerase sigma factor (sigma-70 family)
LGFSESEAQDVAQETLTTFLQAYRDGKYDRKRGRLRSWLFGIARRKAHEAHHRRPKEQVLAARSDATNPIDAIVDDHTMSELWEAEWRRAVLAACLAEVRKQVTPQTMEAFELLLLRQWSTEKAARHLGLTVNAALKAKHRVLTRMREMFGYMERNW